MCHGAVFFVESVQGYSKPIVAAAITPLDTFALSINMKNRQDCFKFETSVKGF